MQTTDKVRVITADAKAIQNITGGGVPTTNAPPIAGMIRTPITNPNDPIISSVQAVIDARALNICGIF